ncbi:MAG TPA: rhodanese-related sulfurtransferase [Candidatus Saccharimonadales bacterium]
MKRAAIRFWPVRSFGATFTLKVAKSTSRGSDILPPLKAINNIFDKLIFVVTKVSEKIILYYKFVPVADPDITMRWQKELCSNLELKGRIVVSKDGINGTLGGSVKNLNAYKRAMKDSGTFKGIKYKWSEGSASDFPKLSVKVRDELVTLSPDDEFDVFDQGKPLSPKEWNEFLISNPDATLLDARNDYESDIGSFRGAIKPKIKTFKEIQTQLDKLPKDKPVLTYCTGDIRCEYLSAYMKRKGFSDVYHLDGGIVKYGQEFGDDGFWEGKCYVFDRRMNIEFSSGSKDIAKCVHCQTTTSRQENCTRPDCHKQTVMCQNCSQKYDAVCAECTAVKL